MLLGEIWFHSDQPSFEGHNVIFLLEDRKKTAVLYWQIQSNSFNFQQVPGGEFPLLSHRASMGGEEFKEEGRKAIIMAGMAKKWNKSVVTSLEAGQKCNSWLHVILPWGKVVCDTFQWPFLPDQEQCWHHDKLGTM